MNKWDLWHVQPNLAVGKAAEVPFQSNGREPEFLQLPNWYLQLAVQQLKVRPNQGTISWLVGKLRSFA